MHKNIKKLTQSGFGLIELMVSISIVVLVTSVILARHDSYNGAVLLRSQAYDMALKIREVQMQAVSVVAQDEGYRKPLGVCFNTDWSNYYYIFADNNGDGVCDSNEYVGQRGNIDPRFKIETLKLIDGGSKQSETSLVILFERPNFDARFYVGKDEQTNVDGAEIGLMRVGAETGSTGAGDLRVMEISRTGQILVQSVNNTAAVPDPCTGDYCPPPPCDKNCPPPPCDKNCDPVDTKGSGDSAPVDELQGVDSNPDQTSKI